MSSPSEFNFAGIRPVQVPDDAVPEPHASGISPSLIAEAFNLNFREFAAIDRILRKDHKAAIQYLQREVNS